MPQGTNDLKPLWRLPDNKRQQTAMWKFAEATDRFHHAGPNDYAALHAWSVNSPQDFHASMWNFLGIVGDPGKRFYSADDDIRQVKIYPDAQVNYAENLLQNPDASLALIAHRDDGTRRELTRAQLYDEVSRMVQALEAEGIKQGDRIAAIVCNDLEAVIGYLACASIGAVWASCSPDFGPAAASDRLGQIDPTLLLSVASYSYAGKHFELHESIRTVARACNLKRIVLTGDAANKSIDSLPCISWDEWLAPFRPAPITFKRLPASAPLVIMFSSGTTGVPKCIVHSAMGLLIQHKKEQVLHCDLDKNDRFFYFTTCGWMMWNWQLSGLATGATLVTYDGNPFYPGPERLQDLIDAEGISVFGTSAKYIDACQNFRLKPNRTHKLDSLRLILSTGSPLIPGSFDYLYQHWKADFHLASISGGTDICACFVGGNPLLPVYRGELQCAMLGLDVDVFDETGNSMESGAGELVCRNAHLSMPLYFWGDKSGSIYHEAYFSRFDNVWAHGDFIEKTAHHGFVIHGRSDTTLNPGGVRIGTAEIYRQVESIDEVKESIVVGQNQNGDQRIILFVVLQDEVKLDEELSDRIRQKIRYDASPRHVPALIIQVPDIPRTRSGKISETAVRDTIHGKSISNLSALANPDSLEAFKNLQALA
tara:strand:+ start:74258 stop:76213 length:1956 start_codon:yes stop_codon:yes gene_type:complete